MASRDELYQALRNADAAGDVEAAQKLATYIQSLPPEMPQAAPPEPKEGFGQSLVRGFKAYVPQLQESVGGLGVLAGKGIQEAFGPGEVSAGLMKSGMERMKAADEQQKAMTRPGETSFTQALDKGVGTVLTEWLPYQVGSGAANLLESLALMGAGTLAGTAMAPGAGTVAGAVTGAVGKELAKKGVLEAAKKIALTEGEDVAKKFMEKQVLDTAKDIAIKRGQHAFLAGQAAGYGFGQVTSRAVQEAQERGEAPDSFELARVLPAGLVSTAAEFIGDKIGLGAFKGLKKETQDALKDQAQGMLSKSLQTVGNIGKGIAVTGTKEAPTEIVQQAAERFGAKLDLTDAAALKEYMDSAAAAYAMSVVPGGIGGLRTREEEKVAPLPPQEKPKPAPAAERPPEVVTPEPAAGETAVVRTEEAPVTGEEAIAEPQAAAPVVQAAAPNYSNMTLEQLQAARENADETNEKLDLSAIEKHFGPDAASAYKGMTRSQRNKWWDANATDVFERDSSVFKGVNEESINEYVKAYNNFDTESAKELGRSIALIARKINDPNFIGSPEYLTLKNALAYAKEQGWSEKEVLDAMRSRAVEWAGSNAQELFKDLFKSVSKQETSASPSVAEDRRLAQPAVEQAKPVEAKKGAETKIITPDGQQYSAQWEVVEADAVSAAMTEGKTQPRDRKRAASNAQIQSIAQNPDFDRLADTSQTMDYGAPTLTEDYAIVGGNGRFEGVNLAYDGEPGQQYKKRLLENADRLGLNAEQIAGMQKPVLVRRITQPVDTRKIAIQSNITAGLALSDMEQAALDAERMTGLDRLSITDTGDIPLTAGNMDVVRNALKDYTTEEASGMMSAEGGLSQAGLRRVKNAILYKAYGKTDTLARLIESPDPDLKNVGTALMRAAGNMSRMMDGIRDGSIPAEYNIVEDLTGAIETLSALRNSGTKVQEFLAQTDMFGGGISGPGRAIIRFIDNNLRSAKAITEYLNEYAQTVLSAESAKGGLFEETKLPTKQETLERAAQKYESQREAAKAQRTLEEQPTGEVRPEDRVEPEGEKRAAVSDEEAAKQVKTEILSGNIKLYHGTNIQFGEVDPEKSGGMVFFGELPEIAQRYAYGGGGQRVQPNVTDRYIVTDKGVIYELHGSKPVKKSYRTSSGEMMTYEETEGGAWVAVGLYDPSAIIINSKTMLPLDRKYPDMSPEDARKATNPEYGTAFVIPKTSRIIEKEFSGLNLLDITDPEGRDVISNLRPTTRIGNLLVRSAKEDAKDKRHGETTHSLNSNFWSNTKYGNVYAEQFKKDIIGPLKEMGYDGIRFLDDQHKTVALFDQGLKKEISESKQSKINEQQAKDAGTPPNITEAMDEYAFGEQVGAKPVFETKVKGEKAVATMELRQKSNKELANSVAEGDVYGVIDQLVASKNPIISQIGKLASKRPYFGIGLKTSFPGMRWPTRAAGAYSPTNRIAAFLKKYADREHVVAHEIVHYLTYDAIHNPTEAQKPAVKRLQKLFDHVKQNIGADGQKLYGLTNLDEFVAEANSNVNFQYKLRQIKYQNQTAWGAFTKLVAQILGLGNDTALSEVIALTEELASPESRTTVASPGVILAVKPEENVYRGQVGKETPPTPTTAGQQALDTINQLGMGVKEPPPNMLKQAKESLKRMGQSPSGTKEEIKESVRKWFANLETKVFSPDARWESDIKKGLREDMKSVKDILGASLLASQSQAVGADGVSTRAMLIGGAKYDEFIKKWVAFENDKANETIKAKVLDQIAEKYGLTKEEASRVAHTYLVAANYEGILKRNAALEKQIEQLKEEGKEKETDTPEKVKEKQKKLEEADDLDAALVFVSPEQAAMVEPGKAIANSIPEVKQIAEIWNEQRRMVKDAMVFSGLWSEQYADALMDNAAYVPFYRQPQVEADEGPKTMIRGLQVKAKEHKLKGSEAAVNDVFENMAMWQQYALNRAIRNHKAVQSIDVGKKIKAGDRMMAEKVSKPEGGMNIARVWRDGKQEFYNMADPYYVEAFQSLGSIYIEPIKYFSAIGDMLRRSVVMYPLFSLGQIPQDSVAAIFASGLEPQYAFKIPFLAVQEFIKTIRGTSDVHKELKNIGVVGVRDFNATVSRQDAEITAGIKAPRGVMGKIGYVLERIAMSADNAVRQAVYQASMDAGLSKAEAVEKATEIINFRRKGSSKMLNLMGQTVPFFYAYLSAQRVAYKTLTGTGISPTERKAALETLAMTSGAVMALSFMYAMANGDDEDYEKTPTTIRDRSIVIPGSGGLRIPLRPDFFLFPKVIAEHTYHLLADNGFTDSAKFKKSMADLFANATLSPNVVPQAIKPTFEAAINYSFFEGKPIVGYFEKNKEAGRQFNESTSEFGKFLGRFGASPQMVDHLTRGYFGSVGGLFLWGTNFMIDGMPGVPRQELTWHDAVTTMPGVGAFKQKSTENALKVDFYELRDAVEKAKNTYDDIKKRSPEGLKDFIENEENYAKLALEKRVTKVADELSKIRRAIQQVAAAPEDRFSASEKQERIEQLREIERKILKAVDVKGMREKAMM